MRKLKLNLEQLEQGKKLYLEEFLTLKEVSDRLGVKYNDLIKDFKAIGFKSRTTAEYKRVTTLEQETTIINEYKSGSSLGKLSTKYNVDKTTIQRVLRNHNIEQRTVKEANSKRKYDTNKVVELYHLGYSYTQIAKELNVSISSISNFFRKELKIYAKSGFVGKKTRFFDEDYIEKEYLNGKSCGQLAKELGSHHCEMSRILKSRGIHIKSTQERDKKYTINESYFKNPQFSNKYLTLGILYTDGCNRINGKYIISIELQSQDKPTLEYLQKEFETNRPLFDNKKKNTNILSISNKTLSLDLAFLGCQSPKSYTLTFPGWVRDDLFKHFLHGCIIGDGWLYKSDSIGLEIGLIGTESLIKESHARINKLFDIKGCAYKRSDSHLWTFSTTMFSAVLLCNIMFKNAPFLMDRKYQAYKSFVLEKSQNIDEIRYSEDRQIIRDALQIIQSIEKIIPKIT